jgi:hypothetical protein
MLLNLSEAAQILQISPFEIERWVELGYIRPQKSTSKGIEVYNLDDLTAVYTRVFSRKPEFQAKANPNPNVSDMPQWVPSNKIEDLEKYVEDYVVPDAGSRNPFSGYVKTPLMILGFIICCIIIVILLLRPLDLLDTRTPYTPNSPWHTITSFPATLLGLFNSDSDESATQNESQNTNQSFISYITNPLTQLVSNTTNAITNAVTNTTVDNTQSNQSFFSTITNAVTSTVSGVTGNSGTDGQDGTNGQDGTVDQSWYDSITQQLNFLTNNNSSSTPSSTPTPIPSASTPPSTNSGLTISAQGIWTTSSTFDFVDDTVTTLNIGGAANTHFGGGYGNTGVTITSSGTIQADGGLVVDGPTTLAGPTTLGGTSTFTGNIVLNGGTIASSGSSLGINPNGDTHFGGGYGNTGITLYANGDIKANGTLQVDGTANIAGNTTFGSDATITGYLYLPGNNIVSPGGTFNIANNNVGTVNIGGEAAINLAGGYGSSGVTIASNGNINTNGDVKINGALTVDGTTYLSGITSFGSDLNVVGDIGINGGDLTTTASTFNLLNTTAQTINMGGAASSINFGGGSGATGCTLDATTGDMTCTGNFYGAANGNLGYFTRTGTVLSPYYANDIISVTTNNGGASSLTLNSTAVSTNGTAGFSNTVTVSSTTAGSSYYGNRLTLTNSNSTNANTVYGDHTSLTDSQNLGNTLYGTYTALSLTGDTSGTKTGYGVYSSVTNDNTPTNQGTRNTYAGYFSATGTANGTSTSYGVYSAATGADTTYGGYFSSTSTTANVGIAIAALTGATSTGIDIGNLSGSTTNTGLSIGTLSSATTSTGIQIGALSSATSRGLVIGGLSGGTANTGVDIGALTGTGVTNLGIQIGALSGAATSKGLTIGNLSSATSTGLEVGTIAGTTGVGLSIGNLSSTTSSGIQIGAVSGTTGTGVAIGNMTSTTSTGISLGTISGTTGTGISLGAISATTSVAIDVANMSGSTLNVGLRIGNQSTATTSKGVVIGTNSSATTTGVEIGALSGTTANTGITIGNITGAASGTNYGLQIGTIATATTNSYGIYLGGPTSAATNYAIYSAGTAQSYFAGNVQVAGNATLGTNASTVNTFGNAASTTNTIGSSSSTNQINGSTTNTGSFTTAGGNTLINNDDGTNTVGIGTGSTTGSVSIGGTGTQTLNVGNGAGAKTVNVGSSNTASTTTLLSGSGGLSLNANNNQATNINTGTSTGTVTIGGSTGNTVAIAPGTGSNTIGIGNGATTGTNTIGIGSAAIGTGISNVTIGTTNSSSSLVLAAGTGNLSLGVTSGAINLTTTTSGNIALTSAGDISLTGAALSNFTIGPTNSTGTITLGQSTASNTINIGNGATGSNTQTVNIAAGTGIKSVAIGNNDSSTAISLTGGNKWSIAGATGNMQTIGNVTIGTTTNSAKLHVLATTEQLRLGYDASNYFSTTVASNGAVTFDAVGAGAAFTFNDVVNFGSTVSSSGNINPSADNTYDLGTTALRWKTLHVGPGSVVVHNDATNTLKATLGFSGSTAQLVTDAATPFQLTTGTNAGLNIKTDGNVGIGTTNPGQLLAVGSTGQLTITTGGNVSTSGTIATTGSSSITSAGAFVGPTATNTINGLVISSGSLSSIAGYSQTTGTFAFSGGDNFSLDSAGLDVSTAGALSGVTTLASTYLTTTTNVVNFGGASTVLQHNGTQFMDASRNLSNIGTIGSGAITSSSTITGTTLNGTTGINTGASAGTQRIDASGNLVNIGTIAAGNITAGTYNSQTISSAASFTGSVAVASGFTVTSGTVSLPANQIDNAELANSSLTVTAGTGLVTGGSVSLGGSVTLDLGTLTGLTAGADTLAVSYGASANTAVQGNTQITISPGTGMSGGGTLTLGSGGSVTLTNTGVTSVGTNAPLSGTITTTGSLSLSYTGCLSLSGSSLTTTTNCLDAASTDGYSFDQAVTQASSPTFAGLNTSGNVGIGTTTSRRTLEVNGDVLLSNTSSMRWYTSGGSFSNNDISSLGSWSDNNLYMNVSDAGQYFYIRRISSGSFDNYFTFDIDNGDFGIDTSDPGAKLDVNGDMHVESGVTLDSTLYMTGANTGAAYEWALDNINNSPNVFRITNKKSGSHQPKFHVDEDGNGRFYGNLVVDGECDDASGSNSCSDYAEVYQRDINETLEMGELLAIDRQTGKVTKASNDNTSLVGIFSESPGSIIGQRNSGAKFGIGNDVMKDLDPDEVPVALTGRVNTKVSDENGPIQAGDYITFSVTNPGVGIKATKPGPVVGKALEDFTGTGIGKVLVFVNVSFADPQNVLANLTLDDQGNLIVPQLKTGKVSIDPSLSLNASETDGTITVDTTPALSSAIADVAASLKQLDASMSAQIARFNVEHEQVLGLATQVKNLADIESTNSATLTDQAQEIASNSASISLVRDSIASLQNDIEMKLTSPDIMMATGSATLATINVSDTTSTKKLVAEEVTVSTSLKSLGSTTLGATTIAGDLTVDGTFTITNGNTINSIDTLYLQSSTLSKLVDFFSGLVTIDNTGTIKAQFVTANQLQVISGKSSGTGTIRAGFSTVDISTNVVKSTSRILITPNAAITTPLAVTAKVEQNKTTNTNGKFTVSLPYATTQDIHFDWLIINEVDE